MIKRIPKGVIKKYFKLAKKFAANTKTNRSFTECAQLASMFAYYIGDINENRIYELKNDINAEKILLDSSQG